MALIVQKFGGSSVGSLERIHHVAAKVIATKEQGNDVIVVVSAMYGETDRLIRLAHSLTPQPNSREYDVLISTGEQVAAALLSMALNAKQFAAKSFTGQQIGIYTDSTHTNAEIVNINKTVMERELSKGSIVVVTGFQGINDAGDITTLGRGGSDTTAVAIAIAMQAHECQIFTDVDGIYTTDPHLVAEAKLLPEINFEAMLAMSHQGAKVLQKKSVELAYQHGMPIRVLSTFSAGPGTLVTFDKETNSMPGIVGIAFKKEDALITISGIEHLPEMLKHILLKLLEAGIEITPENYTCHPSKELFLLLSHREYQDALKILEKLTKPLEGIIKGFPKIAKVSIIGKSCNALNFYQQIVEVFSNHDLFPKAYFKSEKVLSFIFDENELQKCVDVLHNTLELNKTLIDTTKISLLNAQV